jgi:hypothetical protein
VLNAREETKSCLWPVSRDARGLSASPNQDSTCPYPGDNHELFLKQGRRTELRVFNRKFLTEYSITIDAVTTLQTLPAIRNLNEAENLSLGSATLIAPPTAKGGTEGISLRTTAQILYQLLGEETSLKPKEDLDSERAVLDREKDRIRSELDAFYKSYRLLAGDPRHENSAIDCAGMTGAPDAKTLSWCLVHETEDDRKGPTWSGPSFSDEDAFRKIVLRAQDLILAVKAFGAELATSDLVTKQQKIETDSAQYQNDVVIFQANLDSSVEASRLAESLAKTAFPDTLRKEQLRAFLAQQLKSGQSSTTPSPQDLADINELLDLYVNSSHPKSKELLGERRKALLDRANEITHSMGYLPSEIFRTDVHRIRKKIGVELAGAINRVNESQSTLLNRINEIYDHSEVPDALIKNIDLSGHPGNLIVYYTIRRVEIFTRFTIAPVSGLGTNDQSSTAALSAAPAPKGGAGPDAKAGPSKDDKSSQPPGIVVSTGSFEVHSFFRINIGAAFAFSSLKDQSISKLPTPLGCTGTTSTPDTNCFAPVLNGTSHEEQVILAVDYYIHERDTFPLGKYVGGRQRWVCAADFLQCFGPMGGISLNTANSYFAGVFFEPVLGVQFSGGANFGAETTLQKGFQFGTPADVTGDFPTYQRRATGWFASAGFDLGIFRKIFGKVTGIGTATTSTQGS